jgi:hypothetical protein
MWNGANAYAHAEFLLALVERKAGDVPWQATFASGEGYKSFPHQLIM